MPPRAAQSSAPAQMRIALGGDRKSGLEQFALGFFVIVPFLALLAAIPVFWGWGLGWHDIVIAVVMYAIAGHGITIGYHRLFTHKSFKAARPLADRAGVRRRHGDRRPGSSLGRRSPPPPCLQRQGRRSAFAVAFRHESGRTDQGSAVRPRRLDLRPAADRREPVRARPDRRPATSSRCRGCSGFRSRRRCCCPALIGGLWSMSIAGAVTGFFWGALVRISLLHHVTWSINSICHAVGERPFRTRDKSGNVWWLSVLSMGESWHNLHHADPTSARHGVLRGSTRFERAHDLVVREVRLGTRRALAVTRAHQSSPGARPRKNAQPASI